MRRGASTRSTRSSAANSSSPTSRPTDRPSPGPRSPATSSSNPRTPTSISHRPSSAPTSPPTTRTARTPRRRARDVRLRTRHARVLHRRCRHSSASGPRIGRGLHRLRLADHPRRSPADTAQRRPRPGAPRRGLRGQAPAHPAVLGMGRHRHRHRRLPVLRQRDPPRRRREVRRRGRPPHLRWGAMFMEGGNCITYSMFVPPSLVAGLDYQESYVFLDQWVLAALRGLGVEAFYKPINDISSTEGKIGGAAQKRLRDGTPLHHATMSYDIDADKMVEILRIGQAKISDKGVASAKKRVDPAAARPVRPAPTSSRPWRRRSSTATAPLRTLTPKPSSTAPASSSRRSSALRRGRTGFRDRGVPRHDRHSAEAASRCRRPESQPPTTGRSTSRVVGWRRLSLTVRHCRACASSRPPPATAATTSSASRPPSPVAPRRMCSPSSDRAPGDTGSRRCSRRWTLSTSAEDRRSTSSLCGARTASTTFCAGRGLRHDPRRDQRRRELLVRGLVDGLLRASGAAPGRPRLPPRRACPHHHGEEGRAETFRTWIADGTLPGPGFGLDDGAAAVFTDGALASVVTEDPLARVHLVEGETETPLESILLA